MQLSQGSCVQFRRVGTLAQRTAPAPYHQDSPGSGNKRSSRSRLSVLERHLPAETFCETDSEGCPLFLDHEGEHINVMCCDFGVRTPIPELSDRKASQGLQVPGSAVSLGLSNFKRELGHLLYFFRLEELPLLRRSRSGATQPAHLKLGSDTAVQQYTNSAVNGGVVGCSTILQRLQQLTLDDAKVLSREHARPPVPAPLTIKVAFGALCWLLDVLYAGRPIQRFWVLETVARMPYFAALSVLHLYETLGWWDETAKLKHLHFAEEYNESHHLAIMEALGGDRSWGDRFIAQHAAVFYYWLVVPMYLLNPAWMYNFGELVELHAADTYSQFLEENEGVLKSLPPPLVAVQYYRGNDLYMFDAFQSSPASQENPRRPACLNLHDVFINIRDDELEHVYTCQECQGKLGA